MAKNGKLILLLGVLGAIPESAFGQDIGYRTSELRLESNTNYDFGGGTLYGNNINYGGSASGAVTCNGKSNIEIKNLVIRNSSRFGFWVRECSNLRIRNIKMYDCQSGGMRFENRGGYKHKKITIDGITVDRAGGHGVELWDLDDFNIGSITAKNTDGCGVLFNRNKNGKMSKVTGDKNSPNGNYATLRFANGAGPGITVDKVVSRNSNRGLATTSGAKSNTIKSVDISGAQYGIRIVDSSDIRINGGKARGSTRNCQDLGSSGTNWGSVDCGCGVNCAN